MDINNKQSSTYKRIPTWLEDKSCSVWTVEWADCVGQERKQGGTEDSI